MTDFNFSGFEVTPGDWERLSTTPELARQFDMVCVSGSLPSGVSPEAFTDWMTRLRSQCPCIIFDSSREALVCRTKSGAVAGETEPSRTGNLGWPQAAGDERCYRRRPCAARAGYRPRGDLLGEEGALWVNASGEWIAKPPSVEVVSTVGAGDSMVGGLIYGLLMRESSEHTPAPGDRRRCPGRQPEQCRNYRPYPVGRDDGARRLTTL